jgi:hypothetical protein
MGRPRWISGLAPRDTPFSAGAPGRCHRRGLLRQIRGCGFESHGAYQTPRSSVTTPAEQWRTGPPGPRATEPLTARRPHVDVLGQEIRECPSLGAFASSPRPLMRMMVHRTWRRCRSRLSPPSTHTALPGRADFMEVGHSVSERHRGQSRDRMQRVPHVTRQADGSTQNSLPDGSA